MSQFCQSWSSILQPACWPWGVGEGCLHFLSFSLTLSASSPSHLPGPPHSCSSSVERMPGFTRGIKWSEWGSWGMSSLSEAAWLQMRQTIYAGSSESEESSQRLNSPRSPSFLSAASLPTTLCDLGQIAYPLQTQFPQLQNEASTRPTPQYWLKLNETLGVRYKFSANRCRYSSFTNHFTSNWLLHVKCIPDSAIELFYWKR